MARGMAVRSAGFVLLLASAQALVAADDARIRAAIEKGRAYLADKLAGSKGGPKSLAAYALVKTGTNKADAGIQDAVKTALDLIEEHYSSGMPRFGHEFSYTLPCHMFLLEAVDPVLYKPQLEAAAAYLVEHQQENGSWFYTEVPSTDASDTSQTQFALLGLWAAQRADVEIPSETWQKGGQWFLNTQRDDGGYAYQPWAGSEPKNKEVTLSTTLAGTGSLLLVRHIFYPGSKLGDGIVPAEKPQKKKHGVLDRIQDQQEQQRKVDSITIPLTVVDKSLVRSVKTITNRFTQTSHFQIYLFYAMERLAALLDTDTIGDRNWYEYASDELLRLQTANGSWTDAGGDVAATSFGILCLSRTTAAILGKPPNAKKLGGGLLAGARGLPSDLSKLQLKDGQATERKSKGAVDDLLAELEKTQDVAVADVQKAIVESVNLDDPEKLVGEIERLKRLAVDPRAEVRATALWAIGRTGEVRLAPLLIAGLRDPDTDVVREASFALTVLSRKPTGLVDGNGKLIEVDPVDGLDEELSEEAIADHVKTWKVLAEAAWKKWYLSVRPYEERDDRLQLRKK